MPAGSKARTRAPRSFGRLYETDVTFAEIGNLVDESQFEGADEAVTLGFQSSLIEGANHGHAHEDLRANPRRFGDLVTHCAAT